MQRITKMGNWSLDDKNKSGRGLEIRGHAQIRRRAGLNDSASKRTVKKNS